MVCLDTNVVIAIMTGREPHWITRFETEIRVRSTILLLVIMRYELLYGAEKSGFVERNRTRIDDFLAGPSEIPDFARLVPPRRLESAPALSSKGDRLDHKTC